MIDFSGLEPFAHGHYRECYVHPGDDRLCVKVHTAENTKKIRSESKYYRHLERRNISWDMLTRFHGMVETNLGPGAVFDLVRDFDHGISRPLSDYLASRELTERHYPGLSRSLTALKSFLFDQRILMRMLTARNILYRLITTDTGQMVVIDHICNTDFIPICNYNGFMARRKIARKWCRFEGDLLTKFPNNDLAREVIPS